MTKQPNSIPTSDPAKFLGEYQLQRELGRNREGGRIAYLATHPTQGKVVIKQFRFLQTETAWSGFKSHEREIQMLRAINHPCIPRYLDSFETEDGFCMVQEYKDAPPLSEHRHLTYQQIRQVAIAILEILVDLQKKEPPIIHRDIKPENILLEYDVLKGSELKVYLIDFGLAKLSHDTVAVSSMAAGTLGFVPPEEIFNRPLGKAADLYSVGATVFCLLTQTLSTEITDLIDESYRFNFKSKLSSVNLRLIEWLEKMCEPNPRNRYQDAAMALQALKKVDFSQSSVVYFFEYFRKPITITASWIYRLLSQEVTYLITIAGLLGYLTLILSLRTLENFNFSPVERTTPLLSLNDLQIELAKSVYRKYENSSGYSSDSRIQITPPLSPPEDQSTPIVETTYEITQLNTSQPAPLNFQVIDAEYDRDSDRIVMISGSPSLLHIYTPDSSEMTTIGLSRPPTSVSVGPDGKFAAIGHDAAVTYVNLQNGEIDKLVDVSINIFDLILAGNGWIYASHSRADENLYAINIETNEEAHGRIWGDGRGTFKLHPSGQNLYGASRGMTPSNIEKVNITNGTPGYQYTSLHARGYNMCDNLWLSEDGERIFTACGNLFTTRADSDRSQDMKYNGILTIPSVTSIYLKDIAHSSSANKVLAIRSLREDARWSTEALGNNQVDFFDYDTLNFQDTVNLPDFIVDGVPHQAHGRFVFVNSRGTQYYVIVQADEKSGLLNNFGIVVGNM